MTIAMDSVQPYLEPQKGANGPQRDRSLPHGRTLQKELGEHLRGFIKGDVGSRQLPRYLEAYNSLTNSTSRGDSLRLAYLHRMNLSGADLDGVDLSGSVLSCANLQFTNLYGAYLQGTYLRSADLNGANLRLAYFHLADLSFACLHNADLSLAYLRGVNLAGADLHRATVTHTIFENCIGISKTAQTDLMLRGAFVH